MADRATGSMLWTAAIAAVLGTTVLGQMSSEEPTKSPEKEKGAGEPRGCTAAEHRPAAIAKASFLEGDALIIATIPDPIDTAAGALFDGFLDAIQRAHEERGYVLERYHLPWKETEPNHHQQPGILVFASNGVRHGVLLVGETPTGGVHADAFDEAVRIVDGATLRILGPSFSGSVESIRAGVYRRCSQHPCRFPIRLASGSATGVPMSSFGAVSSKSVEYISFNLPDDEVLPHLFRFLRDEGSSIAAPRMALLVESNTGYGEKLKEVVTRTSLGQPIVIPFPMQIGELRRALAKEKKQEGHALSAAARDHQLSPKDTRQPIDVPPVLVPGITAPSIEAALRTELTALAKDGVQLIGIFGTTTADKLFLAERVRKYVPDVRLFTLESDVLMEGLENQALEGMLVASRTPLTRAFPRCGVDDEEREILRVPFTSSAVAGVYDAARWLLDDPRVREKHTLWIAELSRGTFFIRDRIDLRAPKDGACPPHSTCKGKPAQPRLPNFFRLVLFLCFVFVGANLFAYHRATRTGSPGSDRSRAEEIRSTMLTWLLQTLPSSPDESQRRFICARLSVLLYCLSILLVPLLAVPLGSLKHCDVFFLGAGCLAIAGLAHASTDVFLSTKKEPNDWLFPVSLAAALIAPWLATGIATAWAWPHHRDASLLLSALVGHFVRIAHAAGELDVSRRTRWLAFGTAAVAVPCLLSMGPVFFADPCPGSSFAALQIAERFGRLATAPSPLWVVLAIGYGLHTFNDCGLRRAILLRERPIKPRTELLDAILGGTETTHPLRISLMHWLSGISPWTLSLLFAVAIIPPFLYLGFRFIPTLEGWWVDATLFCGLFCVYLAIGHALIRFVWTWLHLRNLLVAISWHPMIHAFDRISDRFRSSVIDQLYTVGPRNEEYELAGKEQAFLRGFDDAGDAWQRATAAARLLRHELWSKEPIRAMASDREKLPAHSPLLALDASGRASHALAAEDNVALHVSLFVRELQVHLFAHLAAMVAGVVALVLAITVYPFQSKQLLLTATWSVTSLVMGTVLWILLGMERDNLLSRLAGTSPGKITWNLDFLGRLSQVIVPLLVLLASQFSSVRVLVSEALNIVSMVVR